MELSELVHKWMTHASDALIQNVINNGALVIEEVGAIHSMAPIEKVCGHSSTGGNAWSTTS